MAKKDERIKVVLITNIKNADGEFKIGDELELTKEQHAEYLAAKVIAE